MLLHLFQAERLSGRQPQHEPIDCPTLRRIKTATAHAGDPIVIGGRTPLRDDVPAVLAGQLDSAIRNVRETTRVPLGIYRGLQFGLMLHPQFPPDVFLEGAITRQSQLSREHQGPRAVLNALERMASSYGSECDRVRQELTIAESQLRDYQARLGAPFLHDAYLSELTELRDQLKAGLAGKTPEPGSDSQPSVSELAERDQRRLRPRTASRPRRSASGRSRFPPRNP